MMGGRQLKRKERDTVPRRGDVRSNNPGREELVQPCGKDWVPCVSDCNLIPQNWVITCSTELIDDARESNRLLPSSETKTPWFKSSRYRPAPYVRIPSGPVDFHQRRVSTSISKPVGGIYTAPVAPNERTNFAINLLQAAVRMRHLGVQYNQVRFHALILKFRRPSAAVLVFSAGRVVCTGAKTQPRAVYLLNLMVQLLRENGYPGLRIKPDSWSVENIVASARMPSKINVKALYEANQQYCTYDPEIFPGVPFRKPSTRQGNKAITVLVFSTGNLVITGAKSEEELDYSLQECIPDIWAARVKTRRKKMDIVHRREIAPRKRDIVPRRKKKIEPSEGLCPSSSDGLRPSSSSSIVT